ncbi:MAG: hypothetical protein ACKVRP_00430 [Bacteroidota bacterium]
MKHPTLLLLLGVFSCETTEPPPPIATQIQLRAIDASCTEAWLEISLPDGIQPGSVSLRRDTHLVLSTTLVAAETIVVDEGLLPNRSYTYTSTRPTGSYNEQAETALLTLDTTNHDFLWQTDTLGDGSSVLYDIAIVNDTLAYAVGEMFLRDSTGQLDPVYYNLAKWNGQQWNFIRIKSNCRLYFPNCGPETLAIASGRAIFSFGPDDIWLAAGGIHHFDGTRWTEHKVVVEVGQSNKIWGSSSSNLWVVGNNGLIVYYNGNNWQRLESGTTLDVRDIYGATDSGGQVQILALASTFTVQTQESSILKVTVNSATGIDNSGLSPDMAGIWYVPGRKYYAVGAGVHTKRFLSDSLWFRYPPGVITSFASGGIRGSDLNNIFAVGSFHEVVHFNGVSWHSYFPAEPSAYSDISIYGNTVMIAGHLGAYRGLVMRGYRQ